jgi:nickel-dependent lactate racemase
VVFDWGTTLSCPYMERMMILSRAIAPLGQLLNKQKILETLQKGLDGQFSHQKMLVLIPDHTRSLPLPMLFRMLVEILQDTRQLDFMVALGTHPPLDRASLDHLVGIAADERATRFGHVGLLNHYWNDPSSLMTIGTLTEDEVRRIAGSLWHPSLGSDVPVRINRAVLEYDHILIVGPTFPHEVAGFSGGAKYLFPGISGPEMIHTTHWLGALAGVVATIGTKKTSVRAMIQAAAGELQTPVTLAAPVVVNGGLAGLFVGDIDQAWDSAANLSAACHIRQVEHPFERALSCAPAMYDELWTAAKAMYKLEPAMAVGGEVVLYAPHLDTVSRAHGEYIYKVGYHILPYFLQDWARFEGIPLGVLAHSAHLCGAGVMENGVEKPKVRVTLASNISPEDCARLNLGYLDPATIRPEEWRDREDQGILYVPKAGEILYRLKGITRPRQPVDRRR